MHADRLTEEAPRSAADLAAHALDVLEDLDAVAGTDAAGTGTTGPELAAKGAKAGWLTQRLARIVAELAQRVDAIEEPGTLDPGALNEPPDPRDDALDQIAAAVGAWTRDGQVLAAYGDSTALTGTAALADIAAVLRLTGRLK